MEYSSNGKGNLGVTLGAIGTGLGVLGNGAGFLSNLNGSKSSTDYLTKDEAELMHSLSAKDSEIALLKADQASEVKMTEVYKQAHAEVAQLEAKVDSRFREQDMWNANQNVLNSQMSSAIAVNTNSISAIQNTLDNITQVKIPNSSVCPGWGTVNIQPTCCNNGTTIA